MANSNINPLTELATNSINELQQAGLNECIEIERDKEIERDVKRKRYDRMKAER